MTDEESEAAIARWFEQNLGARVTRIERQGRWRPAWFVDAERGGEFPGVRIAPQFAAQFALLFAQHPPPSARPA